MGLLRYLFSFSGRINRLRYVIFVVAIAALRYAFKYIGWDAAAVLGDTPWTPYFQTGESGYSKAELIAFCLLAWPSLAVAVKRLHDRNKGAAWIALYWIAPPLLLGLAAIFGKASGPTAAGTPQSVALVCFLTAACLTLIGVADLVFAAGTEGDNKYGPDPLLPPEP